jgi:hypothetical protein
MRIRHLPALAAATLSLLPISVAATAAAPVLGPQIQVNASTRDVQVNPKVAVFPDGGFVVVWEARAKAGPGSSRNVLHARLFDESGSPVTGEFLLTRTAGAAPSLDGVAADGNGSFAVVWDQVGGSASGMDEVYVQRFDRAGHPLTPAVLAHDPSPFNRYFGALAVGANGHIAVIWAADVVSPLSPDYRNDADGRIFSSSLTPLSGELLVALGSATDGSGPFPDSLALASGDTLVAALTYAGDGVDVFVQRVAADGTLLATDAIFPPSECCIGNTYDSSLAMAADGSFAVVWDYQSPADLSRLPLPLTPQSGISGRLFSADGVAHGNAVLQINRRQLGVLTTPVVAWLPGGTFAAAWTDESGRDGSGSGIFGRLLAADGTPIGRDFLINTTTAGNQVSPAMAAGPGGAVAVWVSGPATTIYARRIAAP